MDARYGLAAILRDARESALLRMRPQTVDALEIIEGGVVLNEAFISGRCLT
jgi:hypothetical protein